jgi:5-methylthioadenosine/S-adenosylhomocysteine deaminase
VRIDGAHAEPGGDVFSRLVYACGARDVVHVLIDGEMVVRNREHQRLDVERVTATARAQARKLVARAGL